MRRCLLLLLLTLTSPLAAQHSEASHGAAPAAVTDSTPISRYDASILGGFTRTVGTGSAEAQAYFDQGVTFMYAFDVHGARRSFRMAERADPACAMCFWGEAWALGPYLNEPMDTANVRRAHEAARIASRLVKKRGTPVEQDLVRALATRYGTAADTVTRRRLDSAYAAAMAPVAARWPADLDVQTLYAEALMLLEPRRGVWSLENPSVREIHRVLAAALARDVGHPGACHLYIHATETTPDAGRAATCAERLGRSIPGASHINHMPSHTWNRVGRWGEAVRANLDAVHSDQRAAVGEGFAIYPSHNLHMLLFAASVDGQGAVAAQAARDFARLVPGGQFYQGLVAVRFGRFADALELTVAPKQPMFRGLWAFARGYAQLRTGQPDSARSYLALVDSLRDALPDSAGFRGHSPRQLLGLTGEILRGELLRAEGRVDEGLAALERAVEVDDALRYDEPEPFPFSARDWLGAALLEAGRAGDAERVYREALARRPNNGWDLLGLSQALEAETKTADAAKASAEFEAAWVRADTWIRGSRF